MSVKPNARALVEVESPDGNRRATTGHVSVCTSATKATTAALALQATAQVSFSNLARPADLPDMTCPTMKATIARFSFFYFSF